eukprot:scaffold1288_cov228-Prasinococcus_capsulatus_cf.AAC.1
MRKELRELARMKTFAVVRRASVPAHNPPISGRWVFTTKTDGRRKARFVAKGFLQRPGVSYYNTYAAVTRSSSVRTLLAWAASRGWYASSGDVTNAYINAQFDSTLFVEQIPGLDLI